MCDSRVNIVGYAEKVVHHCLISKLMQDGRDNIKTSVHVCVCVCVWGGGGSSVITDVQSGTKQLNGLN